MIALTQLSEIVPYTVSQITLPLVTLLLLCCCYGNSILFYMLWIAIQIEF